jgi:pimeloyl-ACP methyl ester carboxylesterase
MLRILLASFVFFTWSLFSVDKDEYIVCLHGFLGSPRNMSFFESNFLKDGWNVVNWGYPSRDLFISEHGEQLVSLLIELAEEKPKKPIHFVSHSMGALVLLTALNHPLCPNEAKTGRIALLAPPLRGSRWGREIARFPCVRKVAKQKAGYELLTNPNFEDLGDFPESLEKILVVAGNLNCNPMLKGANDGTLLVEETYLSTPHERIIVKQQHSTMLYSKKVHEIVSGFLRKKD